MFGFAMRKLSRFCVRNYYGQMQIDGADQIPKSGPLLLCANHPNSLLDPVLVGFVAGRPVRFLAKAPLFSMPVLGSMMRALGMIPAFRGRDSAREVGRNTASLDQATNILLQQGAVGIFPEGLSHDRVGVEMVRSGASRMALSAHEQGLKELLIAPIGLNYEDKERFRSAIWIQIGDPINLDAWLHDREGNRSRFNVN